MGRLVNAGSGAGQAAEEREVMAEAQWGPGGWFPPDGVAELEECQGCQSQGARVELEGMSVHWRAGEVAW